MGTHDGRFTDTARRAARSRPQGIRRAEGIVGVVAAVVQGVCIALMFQAGNLTWGGIIFWGGLLVLVVNIVITEALAARARRVHPRGYGHRLSLATWWGAAIVLIAGWFWIAQGAHATGWLVTTAVAVIAVLPKVVVAARLIREGA